MIALVALLFATLAALPARTLAQAPPPIGAPLVGAWVLDTASSHYGPGADRRRWERFTCDHDARGGLRCSIQGERADGRLVDGRFTATTGSAPSSVTGVPGVDAVRLRTVSRTIADATFYSRGTPVFGYRAYRAPGGATLMIVSVDPVSRVALSSAIVYHRR